ncbi:MAG: hypothetical protein JRF18_01490, partial [Deltaproteobacteria bacterium]|nr:hypothetical protein [Deltaproteobacteria bacterium]
MAIQDVETFGCTEPEDDGKGGSCKFWTYYSQPDWTEKIELWIKRYQRKTWYLLDISLPVATAKGFKVSAE